MSESVNIQQHGRYLCFQRENIKQIASFVRRKNSGKCHTDEWNLWPTFKRESLQVSGSTGRWGVTAWATLKKLAESAFIYPWCKQELVCSLLLLHCMQQRAVVRRLGRKECISAASCPIHSDNRAEADWSRRGNVSLVKPLVFMAFKVQSLLCYLY